MKKLLLTTLSMILLMGCGYCANSKSLDILTLFSTNSFAKNKIWVGTFQLAFNDMKNNILKQDVKFRGERQTNELKGLNKEEFNSKMLNSDSYYTSYGKTSPKAKENIKKDIKAKFNVVSDILDSIDWTEDVGKYYAYAMLKKQFEFEYAFDKLEQASFNNSKNKYNFFGISKNSKEELRQNVDILFYNNKYDYAVALLTKTGDKVYLYRTNSNNNFKNLYNRMLIKEENFQGNTRFTSKDTIKVPNLKIKDKKSYNNLIGKQIEGTDLMFSAAIESIELELDNKGGQVKSEGALATMRMSMPIHQDIERNFDFDKTFVMFLVDKNQKNPYLALRIKDLENLNK